MYRDVKGGWRLVDGPDGVAEWLKAGFRNEGFRFRV